MSFQEIFNLIIEYRWHVFAVLITTLIQISPLKLNPWTKIGSFFKWIFKKLGHLFSSLILEDVRAINVEFFNDIKKDIKEFKMETDKFEEKLTLKVEELNESIKKARNDSVDRYEKSINEYKKLKCSLDEEIKILKEVITYEVTSTKLEIMRTIIVRFVGECRDGACFDKEVWDTMRDACVKYVKFSKDNKNFLNSLIDGAINYVLDGWSREVWNENKI